MPNITIGPLIVDALRPVTDLPLDVHLVRCRGHANYVATDTHEPNLLCRQQERHSYVAHDCAKEMRNVKNRSC